MKNLLQIHTFYTTYLYLKRQKWGKEREKMNLKENKEKER